MVKHSDRKTDRKLELNKKKYLVIILLCIDISFMSIVNISSLIPFTFFLLLTLILSKFLFSSNEYERVLLVFSFYTLMALVIFTAQYVSLPDYIYRGLSGPPGGIGTDDTKYFHEAITGQNVYPDLTPNPYGEVYFYSIILHKLANILSLFKIVHPMDLILFNVAGLTFLPIFTGKVASLVSSDKKVGKLAFYLSLFGPLLISDGLILLREGWTAVLFIGAIYFLFVKRYFLLIVSTILLINFRFGSAALLIISLIIISINLLKNYKSNPNKKVLLFINLLGLILLSLVAISPFLIDYLSSKGFAFTSLYRSGYVSGYLASFAEKSSDTSIFYIINQQPTIIRIPLGFLFFIAAPFFSLNFVNNGVFIPRYFIQHAFPLLFLFYFKYFIQGVHSSLVNKDSKIINLIIVFIIGIIILSQLSMQLRHKTMLMPLFYIIVAYGYYNSTKISKEIGIITAICLLILQIVVLFL